MFPLDRAAYDQSEIDWARLRRYAEKVARESTRARSKDYWTLDERRASWCIDLSATYLCEREERTETEYCLGQHGELFKVTSKLVETSDAMAQRYHIVTPDGPPVRSDLSAEDVVLFDFRRQNYRHQQRVGKNWEIITRDDMRTEHLIHHVKGVGLNKLLGTLLR